jgi:hypothetical protein
MLYNCTELPRLDIGIEAVLHFAVFQRHLTAEKLTPTLHTGRQCHPKRWMKSADDLLTVLYEICSFQRKCFYDAADDVYNSIGEPRSVRVNGALQCTRIRSQRDCRCSGIRPKTGISTGAHALLNRLTDFLELIPSCRLLLSFQLAR